jgi:hypothetical protein
MLKMIALLAPRNVGVSKDIDLEHMLSLTRER